MQEISGWLGEALRGEEKLEKSPEFTFLDAG